MIPEQERWSEAFTLLKAHGEQAMDVAIARLVSLMIDGDLHGVDRLLEISERLARLLGGGCH